jgi:hypothetical protein
MIALGTYIKKAYKILGCSTSKGRYKFRIGVYSNYSREAVFEVLSKKKKVRIKNGARVWDTDIEKQ